jgi:trehalose-phosphatase
MDAGLDAALRRFAARRPVLVALDFDGVLAPIVEVPSAARALPESAAAVQALSGRDGVTVALVSGRALYNLRTIAQPPPGAVLVASHGAELAGAPPPDVPRDVLERVVAALEAVAADHPGTTLELKPASAVLHTRQAERDVAARATSAALQAARRIPEASVLHGKEVVEVVVVRADKGSAVLGLARRLDAAAVLYVGDDVTDEHAFRALAGRPGGDDDVTVKVGPGETAAARRVAGPAEVTALLHRLASLLA